MAATVAYEAVGTADPTSQAPIRREWVSYRMVTALGPVRVAYGARLTSSRRCQRTRHAFRILLV